MSDERIDRIEAALDRQAEVNAVLRPSVVELRATAEALLSTVQIHQQNFEVLAPQQLQTNARLEEYQRTTSAALDRIGAVLDYLVRQSGNTE